MIKQMTNDANIKHIIVKYFFPIFFHHMLNYHETSFNSSKLQIIDIQTHLSDIKLNYGVRMVSQIKFLES